MSQIIPNEVIALDPVGILAWAKEHATDFGGESEISHLTAEMPKGALLAELKIAGMVKKRIDEMEARLTANFARQSTALPPPDPALVHNAAVLNATAEVKAEAGSPSPAPSQAPDPEPLKPAVETAGAEGVKDYTVGKPARRNRKRSLDGKSQLEPDSDPKLPEEMAFSDMPVSVRGPDKEHRALLEKYGMSEVPGKARVQKPPFRHPQATIFFLNPKQNTFFPATEMLMRRRDLLPIFNKAGLPKSATPGA